MQLVGDFEDCHKNISEIIMKKVVLLILMTILIGKAQVTINPLIYTTKVVLSPLLNDTSNQTIICRLTFLNWNEPVYVSQFVLQSSDTLIQFKYSFDWCEFADMDDSCEFVNKDSMLWHIRTWFLKYMELPKRDIINVGDERRPDFKRFSKFFFKGSYSSLGYSPGEIDDIYVLFWNRHISKPIICIQPPIEPVRGGDESLYVYDSFTKKIVKFYQP
jgi:hypothetical protein